MASKMKNIDQKKTSLFYPEDGFHPKILHGLSEEPNPLTGFVSEITGFVLYMTGFFLNMTGFQGSLTNNTFSEENNIKNHPVLLHFEKHGKFSVQVGFKSKIGLKKSDVEQKCLQNSTLNPKTLRPYLGKTRSKSTGWFNIRPRLGQVQPRPGPVQWG